MQSVKVNANDMNGEVEPYLTIELYFEQNWSSTTTPDSGNQKCSYQCRSKITRYSVLD